MKWIGTFCFLFNLSAYAFDTQQICQLGLNAHFYQNVLDHLPNTAQAVFEEEKNSFMSSPKKLNSILLEKLFPKQYKDYKKCVFAHPLNYQYDCSRQEEKLMSVLEQENMRLHKKQVHSFYCQFQNLRDPMKDQYQYYSFLFKECSQSKQNPFSYIAKKMEIPSRYIKTIKELKVEINERYAIDTDRKKCDLSALMNDSFSLGHNNFQKKCEQIIARTNSIIKLKKKCSKQ